MKLKSVSKVHIQGGSYLVTIPALIAKSYNFQRGDEFEITAVGKHLIFDLKRKGGKDNGSI